MKKNKCLMTNLKSIIADEERLTRILEEVKISSKIKILTLLILTQFSICSAQQPISDMLTIISINPDNLKK